MARPAVLKDRVPVWIGPPASVLSARL